MSLVFGISFVADVNAGIPKKKVEESGARKITKDFSFVGISWNDTREQVLAKLKKSNLFVHKNNLEIEIWEIAFNYADEDPVNRKGELIDKKRFASSFPYSIEGCVPGMRKVNMVRYLNYDTHRNELIQEAYFVFSCHTNKLLNYTIYINIDKRKLIRNGLIKRYGKPCRTIKYNKKSEFGDKLSLKWAVWDNIDQQSLYFSDTFITDQGCRVIYMNHKHIKELLDECREPTIQFKAQKEKEKKEKKEEIQKSF